MLGSARALIAPLPSDKSAAPRRVVVGEGAALLALGLASLGLVLLFGPARLGWSDEIVYAVMGRNVAAGRGAISGFYAARSILTRGFPLGDAHMPGHALLLATAFAALGPGERVAFVPSALAFLAAGLVLWRAARGVLAPGPALAAGGFLYLFPSLAGYAVSAMAETPLVFLAALHLLLWWRAMERPSAARLVALALVLGIGATVRESFLALLVPTLLVFPPIASRRRLRAVALFTTVLAAYVAVVFWPLYRARAPYPNFLADLLEAGSPGEVFAALVRNLLDNTRTVFTPGSSPEAWTTLLLLAAVLVAPLWLRYGRAAVPALAEYTWAAAFATVLPLVFAYVLESWTGLRVLLVLVPAGLVTAATAAQPLLDRRTGKAALAAIAAGFIALSWAVDRSLLRDRAEEHAVGERGSRAIERALGCRGPHVVVARDAFLYGWRAFPASVVWQGKLPDDVLLSLAPKAGVSPLLTRARPDDVGEVTALGCTR